MHPALYRCDARKAAEAMASPKKITSPKTASPKKGWARNARWRAKNAERYRSYMRELMRKRYHAGCEKAFQIEARLMQHLSTVT